MTNFWYVLRTKPHKERLVWQQAEARGLEVYLPQLPANPSNPRAKKFKPFFPGYVFVKTNLEQTGFSVFQYMPFTHGLVSFGGEPASVNDSFIHTIRRREDELKRKGTEDLRGYNQGDRVWIQSGPFAGYKAIFDVRLSGQERVRVLLSMLSDRHVALEISPRMISSAAT
jgi:transcription antitermination factor NusG